MSQFEGVAGEYTRADIERLVMGEVERALFHCARREDDGDRERINAYLAARFPEAASEKVECGLPLVRPTTRMWLGHCTEPSGHDGAHYRSVPGARFVGEAATREESLRFGRITPSAPAEGFRAEPHIGHTEHGDRVYGLSDNPVFTPAERAFLRAAAMLYDTSIPEMPDIRAAAKRVVEER